MTPQWYTASDCRVLNAEQEGLMPEQLLATQGVHVCYGSEHPCADLRPLCGIKRAVLRPGFRPEEGVGVGDAVWRYTQRSAEAVGLGDVSGSIAVGKLADVILLDRDIFAIPPEEIDAARVLATFVSGEAIFDSGQECC